MRILPYKAEYQESMVAMVKEARAAIGAAGPVRADLYDVQGSYLDKGVMFWLAVDGEQVVGCPGCSREENGEEAFLHRFYVKADRKRRGIGSALLETAENWLRAQGVRTAKVHLGGPREQWFESYAFYPKHGYAEYEPRYMRKRL